MADLATTNGRRKGRKIVCRTSSNTGTGSLCYSPDFTTVRTLKVACALDEILSTKRAPGSERPLWSFSIVTTPAGKDYEWLHDRQPVILLSEDDVAKWLDPNIDKWTKELSQLVQPSKTHPTLQWQATVLTSYRLLTATRNSYPVSPDVGKVGNESPTFIEPISKRKDGIMAMFASQGSQKSQPSSPVKRKASVSPPPAKKPKISIAKEESIEFLGFGESNSEVRRTKSTIHA